MSRVYPGAHCRLIGSANGPKGPSVGRNCIAMYRHPGEHSLHGPIWRIRSVDGMEFISEHGGVGMEVDAAEDWLEVIPPEPPKAESRVDSKDLEKVE